jgi:hypothetical protein
MNDTKRAVAEKILITLYEARENHTDVSLAPIREASGLEKGVFHALVEELEKSRGLIKEYASFYSYEITAAGVLYVEDNRLLAVEIAEKHRNIRNVILRSLADLYENKGSLADLDVKQLAAAAGVNPLDIYLDLSLLKDIGYIRDTSSNTYQITQQGLSYFRGGDDIELL